MHTQSLPYIAQEITVYPPGSGQNGFMAIPIPGWLEGIELWFSAVVSSSIKANSGKFTIGDNVCLSSSSNYYPIHGKGFVTIDATDIPVATNPPQEGVTTFYGQLTAGRVGITSTVDVPVKITIVCRPREFRVKEESK